MSNLVKQIDRIEDIKELFVTEYVSFVKPAGKPPIQTPIRTIHKNNDYMIWRAEIESELDGLPQSYFVDDIRKNFKKIDTGFSEEREFDKLCAKLQVLKNRILSAGSTIVQDEESKYQELELNQHILHALVNIQKTKLYYGKSEDDINDGVRNALDMIYEVKDQTRQGESESGKRSGELDILLCKNSMPWAVVEALKLTSMDKYNLDKHINKAIMKYDPVGCKNAYILIYAMAPNFNSLWFDIMEYLKEYKFPFEIVTGIEEIRGDYSESKRGDICLNRNGEMVKLHIIAINLR